MPASYRVLAGLLVFFALCADAIAQQPLPPDARLWAIVTGKDISAKKLREGAPIKLRVPIPLRYKDGSVLLPDETMLIGTITEACGREQCGGVSKLSFVITRAEWKKSSLSLRAVPIAVRAPGRLPSTADLPLPSAQASNAHAEEIAERLRGFVVQETGDTKTVTAIVSTDRDVVLPTSTIISFRLMPAP